MTARVGRLVLVGTPIGNLGDLSPRAVATLRDADIVCCEDTRHSRKLFSHAGISPRRIEAVHEHNEAESAERVASWLERGLTVAVVTDAGLPGISDPGERLVRAALKVGAIVDVVPGPSAPVAAVVVSGLPSGRFVFEGFLPRKGSERQSRLVELVTETRTVVLLEAPHRMASTLRDLVGTVGPDRACAIARELTKLHEEVWRGSLADALVRAEAKEPVGEHVLVIAGAPPAAGPDDDTVRAAIEEERAAGRSARDAASVVAERLGVARNRAYSLARTPPARP